MRLKAGFVTQTVGDTQFLIPMDKNAFSGVLRSNETAAFVIDLLREETTEEKLVEAVLDVYDADREQVAGDVRSILSALRKARALDED